MLQVGAQLLCVNESPNDAGRAVADDLVEILTTLVEIANDTGKSTQSRANKPAGFTSNDYFVVAALDQDMESWYNNLPEAIKWTVDNAQKANNNFFNFQ
jgi:hypothetical protein